MTREEYAITLLACHRLAQWLMALPLPTLQTAMIRDPGGPDIALTEPAARDRQIRAFREDRSVVDALTSCRTRLHELGYGSPGPLPGE